MAGILVAVGLLLFFWLLGRVPLTAAADYEEETFSARAKIGFFPIQLYPPKEKAPKKKKQTKKKPEPQAAKKSKTDVKVLLPDLIPLAIQAAGRLRRKIVLRELTLHCTVGGKADAAAGAIAYGRLWAAVGSAEAVLENAFTVKKQEMDVQMDFDAEKSRYVLHAAAGLRVGQLVTLAVWLGIAFLRRRAARRKNAAKAAA